MLGSSTLKISSNGNGKNIIVDVPKPALILGDTYTMAFKIVSCTADMAAAKVRPYIKWQGGTTFQISTTSITNDAWLFKSFTAEEKQDRIVIGCATDNSFTTETNFTLEARIYQGALTELPQGSSFDILADTQYNVDGYKGSTLEAINGETVYTMSYLENISFTNDDGNEFRIIIKDTNITSIKQFVNSNQDNFLNFYI